ncbi:MAG: LysR family transcriptional regulator [Hungatella sp.]|jgi:DNA-binding transcriptional LysR family regulator|nr:LysR family transcriptional regulator [Hungatella sp.]
MDIRILKYFLTVAREESITRAAEVLHITQPTLSRQLTQLEEEVGSKLFIRGTRKIVLTGEGMLLCRRAREIADLVDKTEMELAASQQLVEGCVSIGSGELAAVGRLAGLIDSFREKYPMVTYDLFTATADQVKERMESGLIDIGLLLEPVDVDKYEYVRLDIREKWVAVMRPDDPFAKKAFVTAEDLAKVPIIMARRSNVESELGNWFGEYYKDLNVVFHSNLPSNGAVMVQQGLGYALTVEGISDSLWDKGKICVRPLHPVLEASSVLAWKRQQPFGRAAQKFIEHVRAVGRGE